MIGFGNITSSSAVTPTLQQVLTNGSVASLPINLVVGTDSMVLNALGAVVTDGTDVAAITKNIFALANANNGMALNNLTGLLTIQDLINLTGFTASADGSIEQTNLFNSVLSKSSLMYAQITLTAADIKTLLTVPVTIVPAVAGKAIQVIAAAFDYTFVAVPFTNTAVLLRNAGLAAQATTGILLTSVVNRKGTFALSGFSSTNVATNANLILQAAADSAVGDGTLKIEVMFRYVDGL